MLDRLAEMAMEQAEATHARPPSPPSGPTMPPRPRTRARLRPHRPRRPARPGAEAPPRPEAPGDGEEGRHPCPGPRRGKRQRRRRVARAVACSSPPTATRCRGLRGETAATVGAARRGPGHRADLALSDHPLEEIVFHLCRDMRIHPDPAWLNPDYSGADWFRRPRGRRTTSRPNPGVARGRPGGGPLFPSQGERQNPGPGWIRHLHRRTARLPALGAETARRLTCAAGPGQDCLTQ